VYQHEDSEALIVIVYCSLACIEIQQVDLLVCQPDEAFTPSLRSRLAEYLGEDDDGSVLGNSRLRREEGVFSLRPCLAFMPFSLAY